MRISFSVPVMTIKKAAVCFLLELIWIIFISCGPQAYAQELSKAASVAGQNITIRFEPRDPACAQAKAISINKLFCLRVSVVGGNELWLKGLRLSKFDATMPGHHHGMITRPKIETKGVGEYWVEGVKLHMQGEWSIVLNFEHDKAKAQVAIPLKL